MHRSRPGTGRSDARDITLNTRNNNKRERMIWGGGKKANLRRGYLGGVSSRESEKLKRKKGRKRRFARYEVSTPTRTRLQRVRLPQQRKRLGEGTYVLFLKRKEKGRLIVGERGVQRNSLGDPSRPRFNPLKHRIR